MGLSLEEFYSMSMQEFVWRAEHHRNQDAKRQEPFRAIYWVLINANSKRPVSLQQIKKEWPLCTDSKEVDRPSIETMNEAWERLQNRLNHGADRS